MTDLYTKHKYLFWYTTTCCKHISNNNIILLIMMIKYVYLDCSGKVLVIVNYASACGFTYDNLCALSELAKKYRECGLEILLFPSNDFLQVMTIRNVHLINYYKLLFSSVFVKLLINLLL